MNYPKVFIAHPIYRTNLTKNFYLGMLDTVATYPGAIEVEPGPSLSQHWALNMLVDKFLKSDANHIFFVDADVGVPREGLKRLVDHDLPIVAGVYPRRYAPYNLLIMKREKDEEGKSAYRFIENYSEGLLEVDFTGTGCMLIRREVFEKVKRPWFFEPEEYIPFDMYFSEKVKKEGFKIFVDTTVNCTHDTEIVLKKKEENK